MRLALLGFVSGAALLQQQAALSSFEYLALILLVALTLVFGARFCGPHAVRLTVDTIAGAGMGFVWAAFCAHQIMGQTLPDQDAGRDLVLVGVVSSLPQHFERGVRFHFDVEQVDGALRLDHFPQKIALSWYLQFQDASTRPPAIAPGERWQLTVRLRKPHGNANLYGFDYEAWLLEQGVRATGYVRVSSKNVVENTRLDAFVPGVNTVIQRGRAHLRQRINEALPDAPYAGVISALVIGDQRAIAAEDWKVFNRTGIGHLVSISGLRKSNDALSCR